MKHYAFCLQINWRGFPWRKNHVTHDPFSSQRKWQHVLCVPQWVREPDDRSRQSSGIHSTFMRYTCTYSAVTDSHGLYNINLKKMHTNNYIYIIRYTVSSVTYTDEYGFIQTGRANAKSTASLLYKGFDATRPVWMQRLTNMCSKTSALCFTPSKWRWRVRSE